MKKQKVAVSATFCNSYDVSRITSWKTCHP